MIERNRHILKKAILKMPAHTTNDAVWERVKRELDPARASEYFKSIENLPGYNAPTGIWEQIETRLERRHFAQHSWFKWSAAAAVILMLLGSSLIYYRSVQPGKYPEQYQPESGLNHSLIYNPALCLGNPEVCNSPIFVELDKQLAEVKKELDIMLPLVENQDPQLLKYYYRLENLRVEIEKRMVKLIIES